MPWSPRRFFLVLALLMAVQAGAAVLLWQALPHAPLGVLLGVAGFQGLLHALSFSMAQRSLGKRPQAFVNQVMGGVLLKLMASLVFVALVLVFSPVNRWAFVAVFALSYFSCTGLEVYALLANLRHDSPEKGESNA